MALMGDTSVWSLALRRDGSVENLEVQALRAALVGGEDVVSTGLVLHELLRGSLPERTRNAITAAFELLTLVEPSREDYVGAADLSNTCRAAGVQLATVDSLIAQLCIAHDLVLLTTDADFRHASRHIPLRVWSS
ncbi:MAG: VapC toxin family PIN domain ribonuclease [Pseudonocardiales bacterium]|nr:MAG: VapC toxin family PIN domain ribonuclease [Pseudonocardiales bacterium]